MMMMMMNFFLYRPIINDGIILFELDMIGDSETESHHRLICNQVIGLLLCNDAPLSLKTW